MKRTETSGDSGSPCTVPRRTGIVRVLSSGLVISVVAFL